MIHIPHQIPYRHVYCLFLFSVTILLSLLPNSEFHLQVNQTADELVKLKTTLLENGEPFYKNIEWGLNQSLNQSKAGLGLTTVGK